MDVVTTMPRGGPFTVADLAALPDDGHQHQLIDGAVIMTPGPATVHQRAVRDLFLLLERPFPVEVSPADLLGR